MPGKRLEQGPADALKAARRSRPALPVQPGSLDRRREGSGPRSPSTWCNPSFRKPAKPDRADFASTRSSRGRTRRALPCRVRVTRAVRRSPPGREGMRMGPAIRPSASPRAAQARRARGRTADCSGRNARSGREAERFDVAVEVVLRQRVPRCSFIVSVGRTAEVVPVRVRAREVPFEAHGDGHVAEIVPVASGERS